MFPYIFITNHNDKIVKIVTYNPQNSSFKNLVQITLQYTGAVHIALSKFDKLEAVYSKGSDFVFLSSKNQSCKAYTNIIKIPSLRCCPFAVMGCKGI